MLIFVKVLSILHKKCRDVSEKVPTRVLKKAYLNVVNVWQMLEIF